MIYTFYSYKGGVGRSMALVNIAELLYRAGLKVLMVDWDLEAPGLERFFPSHVDEVLKKPGVIDLLLDYKEKVFRFKPENNDRLFPVHNIKEYVTNIHEGVSGTGRLWMLSAGLRNEGEFTNYTQRVQAFDWQDFYSNWEGEIYFEWLREQFELLADVVLIDSRTGVTEMGGVCTYHLADAVIMFCAANEQNLDGTIQLIKSFSSPDLKEARYNRELKTLVVPSRIEKTAEIEPLNIFRQKLIKKIPKASNSIFGSDYYLELEIPYIPLYAFEEMIAVNNTGTLKRSVELEQAYSSLLSAMCKIAKDDSIIKELLEDYASLENSDDKWSLIDETINRHLAAGVNYANAKIALVGDSGVGKTGLGMRLANNEFYPTESTHGSQFWQVITSDQWGNIEKPPNTQIELTLWDFAGQPEYRLVHQLFLQDANVVLLLFDSSNLDAYSNISYWANIINDRTSSSTLKFLVASRVDRDNSKLELREVNRLVAQYGFDGFISTSAKTGEGVDELKKRIIESIQWDTLPSISTPYVFKAIRDFILTSKGSGEVLISNNNIQSYLQDFEPQNTASQTEIETVVNLLHTQGLVYRIEPNSRLSLILLQPELINQYASSILQAARSHPGGTGAIPEIQVMNANLPSIGFSKLDTHVEKIIIASTVELFIRNNLCFREMGMLIMPSLINASRNDVDTSKEANIIFRFSGDVTNIYASLVVRLSYTDYFKREEMWHNAAEFSHDNGRLRILVDKISDDISELKIYFITEIDEFNRFLFLTFISEYFKEKGIDVVEQISNLFCPNCDNKVASSDAIQARLSRGKTDIGCPYCDTRVIIPANHLLVFNSNPNLQLRLQTLRERIEKRVEFEINLFRTGHDQKQKPSKQQVRELNVLHISNLQIKNIREAITYRNQLKIDLAKQFQLEKLDYLVITGDITQTATPNEYETALRFVEGIASNFRLESEHIIIVPGNHDVSWELSEESYQFVPQRKLPAQMPEGRFIPAGSAGALICDEEQYKWRFKYFSDFFKKITTRDYPQDYAEQALVFKYPEYKILFLTLNSAWEIDHHYTQRASINISSVSNALDTIASNEFNSWIKIAVFHHPITGQEAMSDDFLELLSLHGFQMCLHGPAHSRQFFYNYDSNFRIHFIGPDLPDESINQDIQLQYNLLRLNPDERTITLENGMKRSASDTREQHAQGFDRSDLRLKFEIDITKPPKPEIWVQPEPSKTSLRENPTRSEADVHFVYNRQDRRQVEAIADELKRRGISVWIDNEQGIPERYSQDIVDLDLSEAKAFAVFIGSRVSSRWQTTELQSFVSDCIERNIPIIPVLLPEVDNVPAELIFLNDLIWIRFEEGINDEKALDKLEWGITGNHPKRRLSRGTGSPYVSESSPSNLSTESIIERIYSLSTFIIGDRETATMLSIEIADLLKRIREKKYSLIESKGLTPRKARLNKAVQLDRIIYREVDTFCKAQEQDYLAGKCELDQESMIVRFIAYIISYSINHDSSYLAIGMLKLLFNYEMKEIEEIYGLLNPDRALIGADFRRRKMNLNRAISSRFEGFLSFEEVGGHGEVRYKAQPDSSLLFNFIYTVLKLFTPLSTTCVIPDDFNPDFFEIKSIASDHSNLDSGDHVEMNRMHALICPECLGRIVTALKCEPLEHSLEIPLFNLSSNEEGMPPINRQFIPKINQEQREWISRVLRHRGIQYILA